MNQHVSQVTRVMADSGITPEMLKQAISEALQETLLQNRDLLRGIVMEVMEDLGLAEAIESGRETEEVPEQRIIDLLEGSA